MKIFTVNAFTSSPFSGNPAAVCLPGKELSIGRMQSIASEVNLPITSFVFESGNGFKMKWYSPKTEVELCGHGTIAASHILYEQGIISRDRAITFHTLKNVLTAKSSGSKIEMSFPALPGKACSPSEELIKILGVVPVNCAETEHHYIAELKDADEVRSLNPDFDKILTLPVFGVIVTAGSDKPGYDFISRYFAPRSGAGEDPVTGSAHCALAVYWQKLLNKNNFSAYQASKRGGSMELVLEGDRVSILGSAVTISKGSLLV
jgi:PhzF family phenazine biosynthesis protein